jgi:hypothetical protein
MPRALAGRMPRCLPDHRSNHAKRLREVYLDLCQSYHVIDGTNRRLALLVAQSWLTYERITGEIHRLEQHKHGRNTVSALRRLRRQQNMASKSYRFGCMDLKKADLSAGQPLDLARSIAAGQRAGESA